MESVGRTNNFGRILYPEIKTKQKNSKLINKYKSDSIEITSKSKENKSNNSKFDISECGKNFIKGIISPLTAIVKHPLMTVGIVAASAVVCSLIPVAGTMLGVGFGLLSAFQLGKGIKNVVTNYKSGEFDNAEKSFEQVGQGTIGITMSVLGLKQSAKVAKEAKLMSELGTKFLTQAQKEAIALEVKSGSRWDAFKEVLSLFTTKKGLKAVGNQFKPSLIKTRFTEMTDAIKGKRPGTKEKEDIKKVKKDKIEEFKKSPEGIRRAGLSDKEIEAEVQSVFDKAFDELNIPKEQRPQLVMEQGTAHQGGCYRQYGHRIEFSIEGYKSGTFEIEDVIMHEATHCKEALLRAGLPKDRVEQIVKKELISRIQNGESEKIIKKGGIFGAEMMDPPKLSPSMKSDFVQFAKKYLYNNESNSDFSTALEVLLDKHPEFISQFSGREEALKILTDYASSHHFRYMAYTDTSVSIRQNGFINYISPQLKPEEIAHAEESLAGIITTSEGNARIGGINGLLAGQKDFNQYQFSPEEVLAQRNGNKFLIKTLTSKLKAMKEAGSLTPEQEKFMTSLLEKAKLVIEYKTKGLDYYELYTQMINNPADTNLAEKVAQLAKELETLSGKINPEEFEIVKRIIQVPDYFNPDLATMDIPLNVTVATDIIKDNNMQK